MNNSKSIIQSLKKVPEVGLEPTQPQWPKDFKSFVSTIPPFGPVLWHGIVCRSKNLRKFTLF